MDRTVRYLRDHDSSIRNCLGATSLACGLICCAFSDIYKKTFGSLGYGGHFAYVATSLIITYLIFVFNKRFTVPERYQPGVEAILFVMICCITVGIDKLSPEKLDALSIISYSSFTLASVSKSWKSELGLETGFFALFQSLFFESLCKISWYFMPFIIAFAIFTSFLRNFLDSGSSNVDGRQEGVPLINAAASTAHNDDTYLDNLEGQYRRPDVGQVSRRSLSSTNNHQHNQEASSQTEHHSLRNNNGPVLEESISDNNQQEEAPSSSSLTYLEDQPPSENSISAEADELISAAVAPGAAEAALAPGLYRRRHIDVENKQEEDSTSARDRPHDIDVSTDAWWPLLPWVGGQILPLSLFIIHASLECKPWKMKHGKS